jgi:hypothetical protein
MKLDQWQQEVMRTKGNMCLRSGRQVGKSTVIALKAAKYSLENEKKLVMVIAKTEKQAQLLFAKILINIHQINKKSIKGGKFRPTKHIINLTNGSVIHCLAAGDTGYGIMGFTIDLLIADEAAFIPEEVWNSIIPSLAISRGSIWLLSTPFVKEGYYFSCFSDDNFTAFHTSSEDCPRKDQAFLDHKKATITKAQYAQMYLGLFVDELRQFFSDELIKEICSIKRRPFVMSLRDYFLGCDVARMDRDEFTYEIIDATNKERLEHVENIVTKNIPLPESTRKIINLNSQYNFKREYIDSGGMGIAVCDMLREDDNNKRKVVEINNASRSYDRDDHQKRILKEDLYNNLKRLMQQNEIRLLDDDEIKLSLKSIQAEHDKDTGKLKIWGSYSHIAEGLIRAAWCVKDKSLNIFIRSF